MANKFGINCKAYIGNTLLTAAYAGTGITWTEVGIIKNATLPMTREQFDTTVRETGGIKTSAGTLLTVEPTFDIRYDPSNASYLALLTAFLAAPGAAGSEICMAFMDGPIATVGSRGFVSNMSVLEFPRNEDLNAVLMTAGKVGPSSFPAWYHKAS